MSGTTHLYAIKHPHGYVKVGKSDNPIQRMQSLQSGSPYEVEMLYICSYGRKQPYLDQESLEDIVHERLKEHHVRGEWFEVTETEVLHLLARLTFKDDLGYGLCTREEHERIQDASAASRAATKTTQYNE